MEYLEVPSVVKCCKFLYWS